MNTLTTIPSARDLFARFTQLGADLVQLANDYLEAVEAKPDFRDEMIEAGFSRPQLAKLEDVARGHCHPKLLLAVGTQYRALAACPMSVQTSVIEGGVEVLEPDGKETRRIPLDELTPEQSRQAIRNGSVQTLAEQRTYQTTRDPQVRARTVQDVRVLKDGVLVHGFKITKSQMLQWLAEIK